MRGSLGEKIGEGAMADIHAWAPGQVLKLFKAAIPRWLGEHEARMTRAVFAAGGPAPEVLGEVTLEDRFGIVLPRLDGPTLLQLLLTGAITPVEARRDPRDPLYVRSPDTAAAGRAAPARSNGRRVAVVRRHTSDAHRHRYPSADRAPPAGGRAVPLRPSPRQRDHDGGGAETHRLVRRKARGAGLELATCHIILSDLVPQSFGDPKRQRALNAAMQSEYARQAGVSAAALTSAMAPYLPVMRVFVLIAGLVRRPATRRRLLQSVEADLRAEYDRPE